MPETPAAPRLGLPECLAFCTHVVDSLPPPPPHAAFADPATGAALVRRDAIEQVERVSMRTLLAAFHAERASRGLPADPHSTRALRDFGRRLDPVRCQQLLDEHPVLARLACDGVAHWYRLVAECLDAVLADAQQLAQRGLMVPGELVSRVERSSGDPHNGGRQVVLVTLASGRRLVYKPRALGADDLLRAVLHLAEPGLHWDLACCLPTSFSRFDHGWQEFVSAGDDLGAEEVTAYFYRFGALTCLAGLIGATDLHHENIVASSGYPVVVDTETLLRTSEPLARDELMGAYVQAFKSSAINTMLLPQEAPGSIFDLQVCGLGVPGQQTSQKVLFTLVHPGSDAVGLARKPLTVAHEANLVRQAGHEVDPLDHCDAVWNGYRDALHVARRRRGELESLIRAAADLEVRLVVRPTQVYGTYLDAATHPKYLREEARRTALFSLLRVPRGWETVGDFVSDSEVSALMAGDVPYFVVRAGSHLLSTTTTTGPRISGQSPVEMALECVAVGCDAPDDWHQFVLETSLNVLVATDEDSPAATGGVFAPVLDCGGGPLWRQVADRLDRLAVRADEPRTAGADPTPAVTWISGTGEPGAGTFALAPNPGFHDGGGIGVFLDRAATWRDGRYHRLAAGARRAQVVLRERSDSLLDAVPESVFCGLAAAPWTGRSGGRTWLPDLARRVEVRAADGTLQWDVGLGLAGSVLMGAGMATSAGEQDAYARLVELLAPRVGPVVGRPWHDLAHGEVGLRWALARGQLALGERQAALVLAEWLLRRVDAGPTGQRGWCQGAAGLLLVAAEILPAAGVAPQVVHDVVDRLAGEAVTLPVGRSVELSVCHGTSGVVQSLLAAALLLHRDDLVQQAADLHREALSRARRCGYGTGAGHHTTLLGYMLGWAGVADTDLLVELADAGLVQTPPVLLTSGAPVAGLDGTFDPAPCDLLPSRSRASRHHDGHRQTITRPERTRP